MARMLSAQCAGAHAVSDAVATHPTTPPPPEIQLNVPENSVGIICSSQGDAQDAAEACDTMPPPAVSWVETYEEPTSSTDFGPSAEAPATMEHPRVRERAPAPEDPPPPGSGNWAAVQPRLCGLHELVVPRPSSVYDLEVAELSPEEFPQVPEAETPLLPTSEAAAVEAAATTMAAGDADSPSKPPTRPFLVPRPADLAIQAAHKSRAAKPLDPTPRSLPTDTLQETQPAQSASRLSRPCDDPFVQGLQALLAETNEGDTAASRTVELLTDLEVELTPPPPAALDRAQAWGNLIGGLTQFSLDRGCTRAAAMLPDVLEGRPVRVDRLPGPARIALAEEGYTESLSAPVLCRAFSRDASSYHEQFLAGDLDGDEYSYWLGGFLRACLALSGDVEDALSLLHDAGLTQLLRAA